MDKEKLKNLLKKHSDKLFLGALGVDLLMVLFLTMGEKTSPDLPPAEVQAKDPDVQICMDEAKDCSEAYIKAKALLAQHQAFEESKYKPLADFNMFDAKAARDTENLEKRADQAYAEAQVLFDQGKLEEARAKLEEAFKYSYSHKSARNLLEQIEAKLKGGAEPAGDGAAPAASPAATPGQP